jgi:hypothetical protein
MAKAKEETAVATTASTFELPDFLKNLSPEEQAALLAGTGQAANQSFDRYPKLKINKISSDIGDAKGNSVKMGNFVLNQVSKQDGDNTVCEEIGQDFGPNPTINVLKIAQQFSFYSKKQGESCSSQLVMDAGERATGGNYGFDCAGGKCPKRSKDPNVKKEDKCSCQYVVYAEIGEGDAKVLCQMYVKGDSFIPFKEYISTLGKYPAYAYRTFCATERKTNGSNTYWVLQPKTQGYNTQEEFTRLREISDKLDKSLRAGEATRKLAIGQRTEATRAQLPPGMTLEPVAPRTVAPAGMVEEADYSAIEFG